MRMARRMRVQGSVELVDVALLPAVVLRLMGPSPGNVAAWVAVDAVLVVGAGYWFARSARARHRLPRTPHLGVFAVARPVLVAVVSVTAIVDVVDVATGSGAARWVAPPLWLFAVAEYVNYFHVQLSYRSRADIRRLVRHRRLVPAHLGRELSRRRRRREAAAPP